MSACSKYLKRFKAALRHVNVGIPADFMDVIAKKAKADKDIDSIVFAVLKIIEPPNCQKSHCPHYTSFSFCGCSKELVPGRCQLNLSYLKRKREKEEKILNNRINMIHPSRLPISEDHKKIIKLMNQYQWDKLIKNLSKKKQPMTSSPDQALTL